jgi:hypothetical protein
MIESAILQLFNHASLKKGRRLIFFDKVILIVPKCRKRYDGKRIDGRMSDLCGAGPHGQGRPAESGK